MISECFAEDQNFAGPFLSSSSFASNEESFESKLRISRKTRSCALSSCVNSGWTNRLAINPVKVPKSPTPTAIKIQATIRPSVDDGTLSPYPKYPDVARWRRWAGEGIFGCKLRSDGTVSSVEVLKSTGYDVLDQAAIAALRQWRFKLASSHLVRVPIRFKMSGVRHRMSGAVIFD